MPSSRRVHVISDVSVLFSSQTRTRPETWVWWLSKPETRVWQKGPGFGIPNGYQTFRGRDLQLQYLRTAFSKAVL